MLFIQFATLIASITFFVKHFNSDLETAFYALFKAADTINPFYTLIIACLMRNRLMGIFSKLQQFYEDSKFIGWLS